MNFFIALSCDVALMPALIILFELLSFLFVKDKKVTPSNSLRYSKFLLKTGPIIILMPREANSFADSRVIFISEAVSLGMISI